MGMQTKTGNAGAAAAAAQNLPDAELAALAGAGDVTAFERIMKRHNQLLFRTARSVLGSDDEAQDAVQEGYLSAWRHLAQFRADASLATWLVRIVLNESLGRVRKRHSNVVPLDMVTGIVSGDNEPALAAHAIDRPDLLASRAQMRQLIEAHIDLLPEAFRTVFMLRAVEELSVEEVASSLGIPEATVRTRFFRARALLRESMARAMDFAIEDAFSFDGARCDRIVARVLAAIAALPHSQTDSPNQET